MTERFTYGPDPLNYFVVHYPNIPSSVDPLGTVVLIHGGFWRWNAEYFDGPTPMALDLARRGWVVVQVEYRSVGSRGGWPHTLDDIAAALDRIAELDAVNRTRAVAVGHSAGGHLAVWALSHDGPLEFEGAVSLAGVLDLRLGESDGIGRNAVQNFMGGASAEFAAGYDQASPAEHPIVGKRVRIVHGTEDFVVPMNQSESYVVAATAAGQDVALAVVEGADHDDVIALGTQAYDAALAAINSVVE